MSGLEKFYDVMLLVFGVLVLVVVSTGDFEFEYGAWGYVAAFACIGFGLFRMYKMRLAAKALKSEVLEDPNVVGFYKHTMDSWSHGELDYLDKKYRKLGALPYDKFVKEYRPVKSGALDIMFHEFPPAPNEYLIEVGDSDSSSDKGWFALTNTRLIQKDGSSHVFKEVPLGDVKEIEMTGTWTKSMHFGLRSGDSIDFDKVEIFPSQRYLEDVRSHLSH